MALVRKSGIHGRISQGFLLFDTLFCQLQPSVQKIGVRRHTGGILKYTQEMKAGQSGHGSNIIKG